MVGVILDDVPIILLIEENPVVRNILALFFSSEGFRVITAASGMEAQALLEKYHGRVSAVLSQRQDTKTDARVPEAAPLTYSAELAARIKSLPADELWTGEAKPQLPAEIVESLRTLIAEIRKSQ